MKEGKLSIQIACKCRSQVKSAVKKYLSGQTFRINRRIIHSTPQIFNPAVFKLSPCRSQWHIFCVHSFSDKNVQFWLRLNIHTFFYMVLTLDRGPWIYQLFLLSSATILNKGFAVVVVVVDDVTKSRSCVAIHAVN